jgi:hypothetical protein
MVQDWIDWRIETDWAIPTIGGQKGVEIELNFTLPGMEMMVKAFIDRVFVLPSGELAIVDLKTGRTPETAEQLGLYRVGFGIVHNLWPSGAISGPRVGKGHGQPIDLTPWTPERFSLMFQQAIAGVNAGVFLPQPANNVQGVVRREPVLRRRGRR